MASLTFAAVCLWIQQVSIVTLGTVHKIINLTHRTMLIKAGCNMLWNLLYKINSVHRIDLLLLLFYIQFWVFFFSIKRHWIKKAKELYLVQFCVYHLKILVLYLYLMAPRFFLVKYQNTATIFSPGTMDSDACVYDMAKVRKCKYALYRATRWDCTKQLPLSLINPVFQNYKTVAVCWISRLQYHNITSGMNGYVFCCICEHIIHVVYIRIWCKVYPDICVV